MLKLREEIHPVMWRTVGLCGCSGAYSISLRVPTTIWTNWGHGGFPEQSASGKMESGSSAERNMSNRGKL